MDRLFLIGLMLTGLFLLTIRGLDWSRTFRAHFWLFMLIGYMLVSIFWSDLMFISFKRWTREFIALIMALLILTEHKPLQALHSVFRKSIYILIPFSLLLVKYYPQYGVEYDRWSGDLMWIGMTLQKNGLGRLCMFSAFFLVWSLVRRSDTPAISGSKYQLFIDIFLLILTFHLMSGGWGAATYSATAIVSFLVGLIFFISFKLLMKNRILTASFKLRLLMLFIISLGFATVFFGGSTIVGVTSTVNRDATLTGRTDIWAGLLPFAMNKPLLGHGFGGFWTTAKQEMFIIKEAHSGYLELLLELGFIGVFLFSMFILSCCKKIHKLLLYDFEWGRLWACFLLMLLVHNITETSMDTFTSQVMAILLFFEVSSDSVVHTI